MSTPPVDADFEREKWEVEKTFREREIAVQEREQASKEAELDLKRKEEARSRWSNPLIVAILAAAVAGIGTIAVALVNGIYSRELEAQKAEQARILEVIKTGNPDVAAANLTFLLNAGLISDAVLKPRLETYLATRRAGMGAYLPAVISDRVIDCSQSEWDCGDWGIGKKTTPNKPAVPASSTR